nr:hypothetical protein B0A51_02035 [Rachicladosporium sp. CCFEE 5018]
MADDAQTAADRRPGDLTVSGGVNAADNARLHIGNINNLTNYRYTLAKRRSDETLRSDRRNEELLRAAAEGQTPRVRHLLELQADFDYRDDLDLTALHHAVFSGFEDVVSLLIRRGADVNSPSLTVGTPLILAILKQRSNVVELLVSARGINVDAIAESLGSAMHCAAFSENIDIIKILVAHGTDEDRERRLNCEAEMVPPALSAICSWTGSRTPFLPHSTNGCWSRATPILIAVLTAEWAVVKLMHTQHMAMNREWSLKAPSSQGVHDVAVSDKQSDVGTFDLVSIAYARHKSVLLEYLLLHGAEADNLYADGTTLLMRAARDGDTDCLKVLLTRQPEVDRRGPKGRTALFYAASSGWEQCIRILQTYGAQNTIADDEGDTPLHYASAAGHRSTVQLLLESGADVNCVNKEGQTALHLAFANQRLPAVLCLVNAGAKCDLRAEDGTSLLHILLGLHEQHGFTGFVADFVPWPLVAMSLDQETLGTTSTGEPDVLEQVLSSAKAKEIEATNNFDVHLREAFLLYCASCMDTAPRLLGLLHALGGVVSAKADGLTCIHIAVTEGNAASVQDLLAFQRTSGLIVNADLSSVLNECLMLAVEMQHADVVASLLEYGADPYSRVDDGRTIMNLATSSSSVEVVTLLRDAAGDAPL